MGKKGDRKLDADARGKKRGKKKKTYATLPIEDALAWLSAARRGQPYTVFMSNRKGQDGLEEMLTAFLAREAAAEPTHRYLFRRENRGFISTSFR